MQKGVIHVRFLTTAGFFVAGTGRLRLRYPRGCCPGASFHGLFGISVEQGAEFVSDPSRELLGNLTPSSGCAGGLGGRGALLGSEGPEAGAGACHGEGEPAGRARSGELQPRRPERVCVSVSVRVCKCARLRQAAAGEGAGAPRARVGGSVSCGCPWGALRRDAAAAPRRRCCPGRGGRLHGKRCPLRRPAATASVVLKGVRTLHRRIEGRRWEGDSTRGRPEL